MTKRYTESTIGSTHDTCFYDFVYEIQGDRLSGSVPGPPRPQLRSALHMNTQYPFWASAPRPPVPQAHRGWPRSQQLARSLGRPLAPPTLPWGTSTVQNWRALTPVPFPLPRPLPRPTPRSFIRIPPPIRAVDIVGNTGVKHAMLPRHDRSSLPRSYPRGSPKPGLPVHLLRAGRWMWFRVL